MRAFSCRLTQCRPSLSRAHAIEASDLYVYDLTQTEPTYHNSGRGSPWITLGKCMPGRVCAIMCAALPQAHQALGGLSVTVNPSLFTWDVITHCHSQRFELEPALGSSRVQGELFAGHTGCPLGKQTNLSQ